MTRSRPGWRATATYLTYRGLGAGMGHIPEPLAEGVARGVARVMALRGGPALAMSERHMRRVLASECPEGVEPDPVLVRRWSRRTFDSYARYWCDGARLPYESEAGVRARWHLQEGEEHLRAALGARARHRAWRFPTSAAGSGAATGSGSRACR